MGSWVKDIEQALVNLGGEAHLSALYEEVRRIRPSYVDHKNPKSAIRHYLEVNSSDSKAYADKNDLFYMVFGRGEGIWGLQAAKVEHKASDLDLSVGNERPPRKGLELYRIVRDTPLARTIKWLHNNRCQICDETIFTFSNGEGYSEAHHIKPLGEPHNGPDEPGNIIVLCPNHHAMLDFGAIELDISALRHHPEHKISPNFTSYHNANIYNRLGGGHNVEAIRRRKISP